MIDLLPDEDESMIIASVRNYLARELPIERLRPKAPAIDPARVCAGMVELGWLGIGLPEDVGGAGLGLVEEMLIQRECGRHLASPSLLATVLGAHVAIHAGDAGLARNMVDGTTSVALTIPTVAEDAESCVSYALDWNETDILLAWSHEGMGLFDAAAFAGASPDECLDESLSLHAGRLAFRRPLYWVGACDAPLVLRAAVLLAAALTGLAERACELAVEYAKVREQFGKPIGSFQAIKHRCADMGIRSRLSWCQTGMACLKVQAGTEDAAFQAACAKLLAARAAHENARAGIQIHGGIGFQSECDAHWFMKRAHVYDHAGGAMREQARLIAAEPSMHR